MKYFPKITGEKIYLSPINPDDYELYTQRMNDNSITDNLGNTFIIQTIYDEKKLLTDKMPENTFAIIKKENNELIGNISLEIKYPVHRTATIWIFIWKKENQNKWYGTQAIQLMLNFAFNTLNLNNIMLEVFDFNQSAIKCYHKCWFKEIWRRRKAVFIQWQYHDVVFMDILAEEFKK